MGEGGRWEELRLRLVEGGWWGEDGVGGHFAGWRFAAWVVGAVGSVVAEWIGRWWMGGVGVGRVVVCGRKRDAYSEPRQTKTQKGSISVSHVQRLKNFVWVALTVHTVRYHSRTSARERGQSPWYCQTRHFAHAAH